jgi:hypothetical protein
VRQTATQCDTVVVSLPRPERMIELLLPEIDRGGGRVHP